MGAKITKTFFIFISILLLPTVPVLADECSPDNFAEETYSVMFGESVTGCFDLEKNNTTLGKSVRSILSDTQTDERASALKALQAVAAYIQENFLSTDNEQQQNARIVYTAIEKLKQSILANPQTPEATLKSDWQWNSAEQPPASLEGIDFSKTLPDERCGKVKDKKCDAEYERAVDLGRSIKLINASIDLYTERYREEVLQHRVLRRAKWDSYYDDLTFQYFWELWANNYLLEHYDNRTVIDGNKIGFRPLPKSKLVLVHPEVNLAYKGQANDKFEDTVTVEIVGYEAFDFDAMGKVKNPWGVSILAAYLNSADTGDADWTYGVLLKYDGYSVGFTNNDGDVAVVLNFNLSQKVLTIDDKYRRYYDEYSDQYRKLADRFEEQKSGIYGITGK